MGGVVRPEPGYLGTELYGHGDPPGRYITIDRWENQQRWQWFLNDFDVAYRNLDTQLKGLTSAEQPPVEGSS